MPSVDLETYPYFGTFDLANGLRIQGGSDYHFPLHISPTDIANQMAKVIDPNAAILIVGGDIYDTPEGQDSSPQVTILLNTLRQQVSSDTHILFPPGNHDLRSGDKPWNRYDPRYILAMPEREKAWDSFHFRDRITMPYEDTPIAINIDGNRIVIANIFYDLKFIDPTIIGKSPDEILEAYRDPKNDIPDGTYLLGGNIELFDRMTQSAARHITPETDLFISHCVPHAGLVQFRGEKETAESKKLVQETGAKFCTDTEKHAADARRWNATVEDGREWWNMKSIVMGSNVLLHPNAQVSDRLTIWHGHNHRNEDATLKVGNIQVPPLTHQQLYRWFSNDE